MGPAPVSAASALPPEDPTPARRPGVGTVIRHLLGVGLMIAGLWATIELYLHRSAGQQIDETALAEVSNRLQRYTAQSSSLLNALPAISAGLAVAGILIVLFRRHRFAPALVGVLVAVGANGSAQLLKSTLVKPNLGIQDAALNSLPSGHTTFAMAAGSALFLAAPRRWRPGLAILMCAFAVVTGVATVINGWHRPADVVAAIFLVSAWTILGMLVLRFLPAENRDESGTRFTGLLVIPLFTIFGLFLGFTALVTYLVSMYQHYPGAALLGSLCLIGAVGMLCTALIVCFLRGGLRAPVERAYTKVWTY